MYAILQLLPLRCRAETQWKSGQPVYVKVAGQSSDGARRNEVILRTQPLIIGTVGVVAVLTVVLGALNYQKLPFVNQARTIRPTSRRRRAALGASVDISGFPAGKVSSIELDGTVSGQVQCRQDHLPGDRSEAAIKTKPAGSKVLDVIPRGCELAATIPIDRTTSPYQLPDALAICHHHQR